MGKTPDDIQFMNAEQRNNLVIRIEQTLAEQQLDTHYS